MQRVIVASQVDTLISFANGVQHNLANEKENIEMARAKTVIEYNVRGIDIGSANVKDDLHNSFKSQTKAYGVPVKDGNTLQFDGKTYRYGKGKYDYSQNVKYLEKNFMPLLISMLCTGSELENHKIVLGLPINQYDKHKDALKTLVEEHRESNVVFNGKDRVVRICDVEVFPEGMGVLYSLSDEDFENIGHKTRCLIVEIGGKTTDTLLLSHGKYEEREMVDFSTINETGTLKIYSDLKEYIDSNYEDAIALEDAQAIVEGKLEYNYLGEVVELDEVIQGIIDERFDKILSGLRQKYPSLNSVKILLCGGGASIFESRFKERFKENLMVNKNIYANAEGYKEYAGHVFGEE